MERIERFWAKADTSAGPDECWPWTAARTDTGYGQFWDGTRIVRAHRYAYAIENGEAEGDVDHTCHNGSGCAGGSACVHRRCVNPKHLEDVTHQANVARGEAGKASMTWKAECLRGHEYTPENQYIDKTGHQRCRSCAREYQRNRKKEAA